MATLTPKHWVEYILESNVSSLQEFPIKKMLMNSSRVVVLCIFWCDLDEDWWLPRAPGMWEVVDKHFGHFTFVIQGRAFFFSALDTFFFSAIVIFHNYTTVTVLFRESIGVYHGSFVSKPDF